jgi:hypothetical protein
MKFDPLKIALPALMAFLLAACATGPGIQSLYDPEADFGRFTTYNFAPEAKAGGADEKYTSLLTKQLKYSVSREMESRGYRLSAKPGLLVNFKVETKEKLDVRDAHVMRPDPFYYPYPYYYAYRFGFYDPWPYYSYETRVVQYTEGTLNIDLIDAAKKQLVWEGVAVGRMHENEKEDMPEQVSQTVAAVFAKYPFIAGKSEPVVPGKQQDKKS